MASILEPSLQQCDKPTWSQPTPRLRTYSVGRGDTLILIQEFAESPRGER